jgi:hypothetical protein
MLVVALVRLGTPVVWMAVASLDWRFHERRNRVLC